MSELGYKELVTFTTTDAGGAVVYHTNVMMAIGSDVAVVCAEAVADDGERQRLLQSLRKHHEASARAHIFTKAASGLSMVMLLLGSSNSIPLIYNREACGHISSCQNQEGPKPEQDHELEPAVPRCVQVVDISRRQMDALCGNCLEVEDRRGHPVLALSSQVGCEFPRLLWSQSRRSQACLPVNAHGACPFK